MQPDALYATDACDAGLCLREALILAGAEAAWAAGFAAVGLAAAGCAALAVPTFGLACGPFVVANLALVGLDIALGIALADYISCKKQRFHCRKRWRHGGRSEVGANDGQSRLYPRWRRSRKRWWIIGRL